MENENKWIKRLKKMAIPTVIFLVVSIFTLCLGNFLINLLHALYHGYFIDGTLLKPKLNPIGLEMITDFSNVASNIIVFSLIGILSFSISIYSIYKVHSNFGNLNKNQKGSSRFSTLKELRQQYKTVPEINERYEGGGGVPISRHKDKIFIDDSAVNNLIIGTTRSGKGETYIFPAIDIYSRAEMQPSMIFNDPKGELYASSKDNLEKLGYHVEVLNLMNPLQSMSYNLLQLTKEEFFNENYSLAQQYARSVAFMLYNDPTASDKFWSNSSTDLCTALILGLCEHCRNEPEKINMYNVALMMSDLATNMVDDGKGGEISRLDEFFGKFPTNHPARMQYATINFSGGQTRASILANTNAKLGIFTLDSTAKLTSQNTLDMTKFGFNHWVRGKSDPLTRISVLFPNGSEESIKTDSDGGFNLYHNCHLEIGEEFVVTSKDNSTTFKVAAWDESTGEISVVGNDNVTKLKSVMQFEKPIALFMIVPDYDATFNVIASLYVKQVYTTLARTSSNVRSGKCFREVIFMLDEFGNMPPIDDMSNILTVCLGRNIRFNLVIQAYSQIEKLYGDDAATIDGNTNNTFYILTDDHTTAEKISKKIGSKTIVTKSRSGQTISFNKSKTESLDERPLLNADELMRLREGEMIVIRTIKRQDTDKQRIKQFPIYNTGSTAMKYRWEYLSKHYDTSKSINDIDIPCEHASLDLENLRVDFEEEVKEVEEIKKSDETEKDKMVFTNSEENQNIRKVPKSERMKQAINLKHQELESTSKLEITPKGTHEEKLTASVIDKDLFILAFKDKERFTELFGDIYIEMELATFKNKIIAYKDEFQEHIFLVLLKQIHHALGEGESNL